MLGLAQHASTWFGQHKGVTSIRSDQNDTLAATRLLELVQTSLDDDKAEDVAVVDLAGKTTIADHMVVACGRSQRQVGAIAEHLARRLKDAGFGTSRVEGMAACDWVLIDAGDVIVHVFRPEVRGFYNLEKMWSAELVVAERAVS
jgi:ribosome-associated protein